MDIDIADLLVEEITSEYLTTVRLSGGVEVRIETAFELAKPDRTRRVFDPQDLNSDQELQRVLSGRNVEQATSDVGIGSLAIAFDGGVSVSVMPDADFAAWSVVWSDGSTIGSGPCPRQYRLCSIWNEDETEGEYVPGDGALAEGCKDE